MQLGACFCCCTVLLHILLLSACKLHAQWYMPTSGSTAFVCSSLLSLSFTATEHASLMFVLFTAWRMAVITAATLGSFGDLDVAQWLLSCCHNCRVLRQLTWQ